MIEKQKTSKLKRFGVSIEEELLKKFDRYIQKNGYINRSEALRDLVRKELVEEEWLHSRSEGAGAIILVYDHHQKELLDKIISIQHDFAATIVSSLHVHIDHHNCLEVIIARGKVGKIKDLESRLKAAKGVKHVSLSRSTLAQSF